MKRIIKTLFFLLIPLSVFGQITPITGQYVLNPLTINPAFAGSRGALNIAALYRKQWTGIEGTPKTLTFSIDAPFSNRKIGLGLIIGASWFTWDDISIKWLFAFGYVALASGFSLFML